MLIVLRDGMIWPDGYGGDETTNAAWVATGQPKLDLRSRRRRPTGLDRSSG